MANYQSIPRRFNRPTSSINHAYIDKTLKDKQGTIDTNFGLLQQTVDATLGQDLIRDKDREYLKDKVRGVLNTLDRTDEIHFDSKKTRSTIQDSLNEAAKDPEILKQIGNTKKIRQVQQFYKDREKKGDINQQNFQYAYRKSGIDAYIGGGSDSVNDFKYSEYIDVDAKLDEVARKLKSANPNELVSIQNPLTGKTVSKKVSMVTPEEMRGYLRIQLNANDLKQLEIDGSMLYGIDDNKAVAYRDTLIANNKKQNIENVSLLENFRDNGNKTPGQIAEINEQIETLGAERASYESRLIGQKTAEVIGGQQLIEDKIQLFSKLYTKNGPESIKYDSGFLKRMRDANSLANINANSPVGNSNISTITAPKNLKGDVDPLQEGLNRMDKALTDNSTYLQNIFNDLGDDQKKLINKTMEDIKNDPQIIALYKGQTLSNEALQMETINRLGANFFPPDIANELKSKISETKNIQEGVLKTTDKFIKTQALQQETFDQTFFEETNLTMITPKGETTMQDFLKENGVSNFSTYKSFVGSDSKEAKQFRATLALQSMSLTNNLSFDDVTNEKRTSVGILEGLLGPLAALTTINVNAGVGTTNKIDLTRSEYLMMRQAAHDLTGEPLDETYSVKKDGEDYTLSLKDENTNFSKIVSRTNSLYQEGRSISKISYLSAGDTDRTIRNESAVRDLFKDSKFRDFASNNLQFLDKTVAGNNSIRIQGHPKQMIDPIYREVMKHASNITWNLKRPIDIYKKEDGSLFISQIKKDQTTDKDGDVSQETQYLTATIQANDVKKMDSFNNQITLLQKEASFKTLDNIVGEVKNMNFIGNNKEQVDGLNRLYNKSNPIENGFRLLSDEASARKMIFNSENDFYLMKSQEGQKIKQQFEDFVTNTHKYSLDFTKGVATDYQVLIKTNNGKDIVGKIPLEKGISVEAFEKAYQGTPQVFLSMYSKSQVDEFMKNMINGRR